MNSVTFKEQNGVLGKPPDMTDAECGSLPVFKDGQNCISCWEPTDAEIEDIIKTRRIYILLLSGPTQPPMAVSTRFDRLL